MEEKAVEVIVQPAIDTPVITGTKLEKPGTFKKGVDPRRNLGGRPQGAVDFKTKFYRAIDKLAKKDNLTADDLEEELILMGFKKASEGDYSFYRDLLDRLHGRPTQKVETDMNLDVTNIDRDPQTKLIAEKYEEELRKNI